MKQLLSALLAALACTTSCALAKSAVPPSAPADAVTDHQIVVAGTPLEYQARAGAITVKDSKGAPGAQMFYTAYTAKNADPEARPVTFVFNGGPGSATIWLRMGSFGPVRVITADGTPGGPPPYKLVENRYTLLDKTDLVFIDAPGTGYSVLLPGANPKDFYGVDQDVNAFAQFIQQYVTRFHRWNSPKFLFGESYGTTRAAALVDRLQNTAYMPFNGVVLLSSAINWSISFPRDPIGGDDWPYVAALPTEAAVAWYHHKTNGSATTLPEFVRKVRRFALTEYMPALAQGAGLSPREKARIIAKLHDYTGLSVQYLRNSNMRFPYWRFEKELRRNEGLVVGRLDGRFQTRELDSAGEAPNWDPADVAQSAPFVTTFNDYIRNDLKYDAGREYVPMNISGVNETWDFEHNHVRPTNVAPDLAEAMTTNPHLRVFSANGYYDMATPFFATEYTLSHLNLAPELQEHITYGFYESGHMVYVHEQALAQFRADLGRWYDAALGNMK